MLLIYMYISSYSIVLILDKGAAPRNVEIKFFKSFIMSVIIGFKTWDKEVCDNIYIYIYIYIYMPIYLSVCLSIFLSIYLYVIFINRAGVLYRDLNTRQ